MTGDKFTLKESPDYESEFKIGFIRHMTDSSFIGNWVDKTKDKKLKCELRINSDKQINLANDIVGIEGNYESLFNS